MANIAVTGAAGNVGRQALAALGDDHDVTALTHRPHDDLESDVLEVTDRAAFVDALEGADVLVHLAANPSPFADWDDLREPNVEGVYNAYEAARANALDRVLFASSNHAVHMYNAGDPTDPESLAATVEAVHSDQPTNPDSPYGVTKVTGEAMGSLYANRHDLEVVNLRIGWLLEESDLRENDRDPDVDSRFLRAMWLSPRDCRNALRGAATTDLPETPLTVHVVSDNDDRYLSITRTLRTIDYRPRDNAAAVLDDASES